MHWEFDSNRKKVNFFRINPISAKFGGVCVVWFGGFFPVVVVVACIHIYILEDGLICIVKKFYGYDVKSFTMKRASFFKTINCLTGRKEV